MIAHITAVHALNCFMFCALFRGLKCTFIYVCMDTCTMTETETEAAYAYIDSGSQSVRQAGRQAGKQTLSTDAFSEILRICYTSKLSPFASTSMPPSSLFIITLVSFLIFCRCCTLLSSLFSFFFFLVWFSYLLLLWLLFLFLCDSVSLIWQFCLYAMHKYAAAHVRLFTSCFNIALEWIYVYSETGCSNNKAFLSQFRCSYFNDDFFFS